MKTRKPTHHALIAERTRVLDAITESTAKMFWLSTQLQKERDVYMPLKKQFDVVQAQLKALYEAET
jgi:hypothetical protein